MSNAQLNTQRITFGVAEDDATREAIYRFRYDTLVRGLNRELPGVDHAARTMRDAWDDCGILSYAESEGIVIGTIRANDARVVDRGNLDEFYGANNFQDFYPAGSAFLSRLVIHPQFQGIGILAGVLKQVYMGSKHFNPDFAFSHCRPQLLRIMEHCGNVRCAPNFVAENGTEYTPIVIALKAWRYHKELATPIAEFLSPEMDLSPSAQHFYTWKESMNEPN